MLIGEVSRHTGISARMLRHYEELGLVSPHARTSGGYRDYSEEDLRQLLQVEALRSLGLPLAHIAELLAEGVGGLPTMIDRLIAETRQRINRDRELLRRLQLVRKEQPEATAELLEVIDVLRQLRSGDPAVRHQAALGHLDPASARGSALTEALLREDNDDVAGALQWALERSGSTDLGLLHKALAAQNPRVRRRAANLLTGMAGADVDKLLETLVDDADDLIRSRAILALSRRGSKAMVPRLLGMIVEGLLDVEAAELLGELVPADEKVVGELEELLAAPGTTPGARLRLVQALAEIPGPRSGRLLAALIDDEDRVVAGTARYILGEHGNG
ncbi:MerR family transcriptional regulator [Corynebacterium hylobatis]|uniref:MerR family transcriptional regulator n=1 Tax=Corynebacterium hylobatis TaxID=1859290 RepID=A0A430HVR0_9CORY|nr:MerR family transcriptional regulator [Corynebacterium hylobatis]RSZ61673.1 MerR family transcriptional regulator [Corynebacterium hylobatis]